MKPKKPRRWWLVWGIDAGELVWPFVRYKEPTEQLLRDLRTEGEVILIPVQEILPKQPKKKGKK